MVLRRRLNNGTIFVQKHTYSTGAVSPLLRTTGLRHNMVHCFPQTCPPGSREQEQLWTEHRSRMTVHVCLTRKEFEPR